MRINYKHQIIRLLWGGVWTVFVRPLPRDFGKKWKRFLLRIFGAQIHPTARVYSSATIYYPANLVMEERSCIGPQCDIYNVDKVILKKHAMVSQKAYLCTASHEYREKSFPLITASITIGERAWVAADAFIGMGITVGEGAVIGARAAVFKDVEPWTIVGGNPAKFIKQRERIELNT